MRINDNADYIDSLVERFSLQWRDDAKIVVKKLYELMKQGNSVEKAVDLLRKKYPRMFKLAGLEDALLEAACHGYGILPEILTDQTRLKWSKTLNASWDASKMTLSQKLHGAELSMRNSIIDTVTAQMRKNASWVQMARALYDGYATKNNVVRQQEIAKYMQKVRVLSNNDRNALLNVRRASYNVERLARNGSPTLALKTAYKQILDAAEQGSERALQKAIDVAVHEKSRYVAERIARTEMARAYADGFFSQWDNNEDVVAYRYKLNTRHPVFDICDMFAHADLFGLGAGVFPKDKVAEIPIHPHCMCKYAIVVDGRVDMSKEKEQIDDGVKKWLNKLNDSQQRQALGVDGADNFKENGDWSTLRGWHGLRNAQYRHLSDIVRIDEENALRNAVGQRIILAERRVDIFNGEPNSIVQIVGEKGGISRTYFDSDGRATKQISNNDHGTPKRHNFGENGEHAHDYQFDEYGKFLKKTTRELNDEEKKENADIL